MTTNDTLSFVVRMTTNDRVSFVVMGYNKDAPREQRRPIRTPGVTRGPVPVVPTPVVSGDRDPLSREGPHEHERLHPGSRLRRARLDRRAGARGVPQGARRAPAR